MSGSPTALPVPIDALLEPAYLLDLGEMSMAELRERRTQCALVESSVSYERQLIQGRLDIVRDEQGRRGDNPAGADATGLVERLPAILTLHAHAAGVGRPPTFMFPVHLDADRQARMNLIAPARTIASLAGESADDVNIMCGLLEAMEQEISAQRRALHVVFDRIQSEVIRRYKSGEVPIEAAFFVAPDLPLAGPSEPLDLAQPDLRAL
jgi:hypothetical protein